MSLDEQRARVERAIQAGIRAAKGYIHDKENNITAELKALADLRTSVTRATLAELDRLEAEAIATQGKATSWLRQKWDAAVDFVKAQAGWIVVGGVGLLALLMLATIGSARAAGVKISPEQQARNVVYQVISRDPLARHSCSAVLVQKHVLATARHCMASALVIVDPYRKGVFYPVEGTQGVNPTLDVILLYVPSMPEDRPIAKLIPGVPALDEPALVVGFPYGITAEFVTHGTAQGEINDGPHEYYVTDAGAAPGVSGGGYFIVRDGVAYLAGIVVMIIDYEKSALTVVLVEPIQDPNSK